MRETHYELFLRKTPKSSWVLMDAVSERKLAVEKAQGILKNYPSGGVRVLKEQRSDGKEDFDSVVVASFGNCDDARKSKGKVFKDVPSSSCVSPLDLFKPEARKTYQEVLPRFLAKHRVLPGELVYRADLVEMLEAGGSDITHAIQRVAIARSGGGDDLHAISRQLHELVSQGISQFFKDRKSGRHMEWDGEVVAMIAAARKKKNPGLAFSTALVDRLKKAPSWDGKLQQLIEVWAETETLPEDDKIFCNEILTHYFSEWIEAPNTLAFMIGKTEHSAEVIHRLIAILEPEHVRMKAGDPLAELPAARTLAKAINLEVLPTAKNRIISMIFAELASPRRLYPGDLQKEFDLLKNFGDRLVHLLMGQRQSEMYGAFAERSKTLMNLETVEAYLGQFDTLERPKRLLDLGENLAGDIARSRMVNVLRAYISQPQFEVAVLGTKNPLQTLSVLRDTQLALTKAKLPEQDRLLAARDLDTLGVRLLGQSKVFGSVIKKAGTPERAALALFRLGAETLPFGQCARLAAGSAVRVLQTDGTQERLAAHPDMKLALAQMARAAQSAADQMIAS